MFKLPIIFTILTFFTITTLAHPTPSTDSNPLSKRSFGPYLITNYKSSCSTAACSYTFNITYTTPSNSTASITEPSFATYCQGTDKQGGQRTCADKGVSANSITGVGNATLVVQHSWVSSGARFLIEGNLMVMDCKGCNQSLSILPSKAWAVAK